MVVLFASLFGIMDCARALYCYHFVSYAARQGTRYAMVRGSTWSSNPCANTTSFDCDATASNILQDTLLSFVPGAYDLGTFLRAGGGAAGLSAEAEHPLVALLDILPAGSSKLVSGALADSAIALNVILARLYWKNGPLPIPGFYDRVRPMNALNALSPKISGPTTTAIPPLLPTGSR